MKSTTQANRKKTESKGSSTSPDRERHEGSVVWFNALKGYGFLRPTDKTVNNGKDLFVHFHYIVQRGFKTLKQGDIVEFSVGENKSGPCAQDVKMIKAIDNVESRLPEKEMQQ